jgi:hypothetical protein
MKCPICKEPMLWKEGLFNDGYRDMTVGRYYCTPCGVAAKMKESNGVRKGRKLLKELDGVDCLDKRITGLPNAVQIGLLRERQKAALTAQEEAQDDRL